MILCGYGRQVKDMSITGYYDGTSIRVKESLQVNQKVLVIPIESEEGLNISAAGGWMQMQY